MKKFTSVAIVLLLTSIAQAQWVPSQQDAMQEQNFCILMHGQAAAELPNYSDARLAAEAKIAAIEAAITMFDPMDPRISGWDSSLHDLVMLVVEAECDGSVASTLATSAFSEMQEGDFGYSVHDYPYAYFKYYYAITDYFTCCLYACRAANNLKGGAAQWGAPAVAVQNSVHYQLDQLLATILASA